LRCQCPFEHGAPERAGEAPCRQPRLTPKQDAAVTAHYEAGDMSVPEIAALFNVSRPSVYRSIDRHRRRLTFASSSR
jgi:DNA-binding MarR family transcriptional regulator